MLFSAEVLDIPLTMLMMKNLGAMIEEHADVLCLRAIFGLDIPRFLIPLRIAGAAVLATRSPTNNSTEQSERSFILDMVQS